MKESASGPVRIVRRVFFAAIALAALTGPSSAGILDYFSGGSKYDSKLNVAMLEQLEKNKGLAETAYVPTDRLLQPYARASLGPDIAFLLINQVDIVSAPEAQRLCQALIDQLMAGWSGPKPHVRIVITGDASYGASASIVGDILVSIGTFNNDPSKGVQNKEELALMLGHELSHILLLHVKQNQDMAELVGAIKTATSIAMTYSMVRKSHISGNTLQVATDRKMLMQTTVGGLAGAMLVGDLLTPSWGRSAETEADKLGLDLAKRAGYAVSESEIRQFINKHMDSQEKRSARMQKLQATATLMIMATKTDLGKAGKSGSLLELGIKLFGANLLDKAFAGLTELTTDHPKREEREADLETYYQNVYAATAALPGAPLKKKQSQEIKKLAMQARLKQTLASVTMARKLDDMLLEYGSAAVKNADKAAATEPKLPSACGTRRAGPQDININFPTDSAPQTWRSRANWHTLSQGCEAQAKGDYEHSVHTNLASPDVLSNLTLRYAGTPQVKQLPALYDHYKTLIGTDAYFPDLAVAAAVARHDQVGAEVKAAECYGYDRQSHYPTCVRLLGYDPLAKDGEAKTPEGKKAFSAAKIHGDTDALLGGFGLLD
jgi:Zn-dependent protease with chaperone function